MNYRFGFGSQASCWTILGLELFLSWFQQQAVGLFDPIFFCITIFWLVVIAFIFHGFALILEMIFKENSVAGSVLILHSIILLIQLLSIVLYFI